MYYDDEQDYIPWSRPHVRSHPVVAALLVIALAIVAWQGLASYLRGHRGAAARVLPGPITMHSGAPPTGSVRPRHPPPTGTPAVNASPPTGSTAGSGSVKHDGDATTTRTDTALNVQATRAFRGRTVSASASSSAPSPTTALADQPSSAARPRHDSTSAAPAAADTGVGNISPFRRTHPWAAVPGQRYYFPSNCPSTLRLRDLVFFRTEEQARADGFQRSPSVECQ